MEYIDISSGRRHNRKIAWGKIFLTIFFLVIGICGMGCIYVYKTLKSFNYQEIEEKSDNLEDGMGDETTIINDNMVLNVLLLGSDSQSAGDGGRTDTMLVVSLDARDKKIKITSLMRDIWVYIPGYSRDRLNAAYALGGVKKSIETIKYNFGIKIDRYAMVDFDSFEKIIDSIGGIDIKLTAQEVSYINKESHDKNILKGSGVMHLNGRQALTHARNRDSIGSDYDRTERQRNVIKAMMEKGKTLNVAQITKLVSTIAPLVTTNFKTNEITKLASKAMSYFNFQTEQFRLPTDDNVKNETIDSKMVLVIKDMQKARKDLLKFIYGDRVNLS